MKNNNFTINKLKKLIKSKLKEHNIYLKDTDDYNSMCHLVMYLQQDGIEDHKYMACDIVGELIKILFLK